MRNAQPSLIAIGRLGRPEPRRERKNRSGRRARDFPSSGCRSSAQGVVSAGLGAFGELARQPAVAIDKNLHPARGWLLARQLSMVQTDPWLRQNASCRTLWRPSRSIRSASGHNNPDNPVGPTMTGIESVLPKSSIERSRVAAPRPGRGRSWMSFERRLVTSKCPLVLCSAVGELEDRARQSGGARDGASLQC